MKTNGYREEYRKKQRVSSRLAFIIVIGLICIVILYVFMHAGPSKKNITYYPEPMLTLLTGVRKS